MKIEVINTEQDYRCSLERLEVIFDAELNSKEGDELEILGLMIDDYEKIHFPIDLPDPIEARKFRTRQVSGTD